MSMKIEWHGLVKLAELAATMDAAAAEVADKVASDARALAPVESGALRNSIKASSSRFKGGGALVKAGGGDQYYATFIELGTRKKTAHPFLRPAMEKNRSFALRRIKAKMSAKLR